MAQGRQVATCQGPQVWRAGGQSMSDAGYQPTTSGAGGDCLAAWGSRCPFESATEPLSQTHGTARRVAANGSRFRSATPPVNKDVKFGRADCLEQLPARLFLTNNLCVA
jgi:hypothetical protein